MVSASPASMVGGQLVVTSWHTRIHLLMPLLSGIAWIAALLVLVVPMKRDPHWRGWHILNIVAVLLVFVGSFTLRGAVGRQNTVGERSQRHTLPSCYKYGFMLGLIWVCSHG